MKLKDNILVIMRLEGKPLWLREIRDKLPPHHHTDYYLAIRELYQKEIVFNISSGWEVKK